MANTTAEKILESLSGLVPEEAQEKVSSAISSMVEDLDAEYKDTYDAKLKEAYDILVEENKKNVEKAENGYDTACEIIADLRNRLEIQREEFEKTLEEEYEEAYQMLIAERAKNEELEVQLYEEYDARLKDIKDYMVDKVDQFLAIQGEKFYEMAKEEVLNDPCLAEHKVAFDKIVEVVGDFVDDEEHMFNTSSKVNSLREHLEKETKEKRILEAKIMRLESDNNKLNEVAMEAQKLLQEQMLNEEKEWVERGRNAEGRGEVESDEDRKEKVEVIKEYASKEPAAAEVTSPSQQDVIIEQWQRLAGMNNDEE